MPRSLAGTAALVLLLCAGCASSRPAELPTSAQALVTHPRDAWDAAPPVLPMQPHDLDFITIHHTATPQRPERTLTDKLSGLQQFSQRQDSLADGRIKPAWADVPYHFYIDVHGQIGEGREVGYVGDTNTAYDPTGHVLIVLEGNFEVEQPSLAQRTALQRLTTVLARHWRIPAERIAAHRDYADTLCPGQTLYDWMPALRASLTASAPSP